MIDIKMKNRLTAKKADSCDKDLSEIKKLYENSFPIEERFPFEKMVSLCSKGIFDIYSLYTQDSFAGFFAAMTDEKTAYICYFAIEENLRGQGLCSETIGLMKSIFKDRQIVLETEIQDKSAENYSQRKSRKAFYLRNGFEETLQLIRYSKVTYEILCSGKFSLCDFEKLIDTVRSNEFQPLFFSSSKTYSTYIFDLDGTLLDTLTDLSASTNYALKQCSMPQRKKDEVRQFVGNGIEKLMERAVPDGKNNPDFDKAFSLFKEHYAQHCSDNTKAYGGINSMLLTLKENGKKLAIVSNKADFAVKELCRIYFKDLIEIAIGEKADVHKKPAPDTVFTAMKQLGSQPDECIYIGDSDVDICTAENAGVDCISVLWGFRDEKFLYENRAKAFVEKPEEICLFTLK